MQDFPGILVAAHPLPIFCHRFLHRKVTWVGLPRHINCLREFSIASLILNVQENTVHNQLTHRQSTNALMLPLPSGAASLSTKTVLIV